MAAEQAAARNRRWGCLEQAGGEVGDDGGAAGAAVVQTRGAAAPGRRGRGVAAHGRRGRGAGAAVDRVGATGGPILWKMANQLTYKAH